MLNTSWPSGGVEILGVSLVPQQMRDCVFSVRAMRVCYVEYCVRNWLAQVAAKEKKCRIPFVSELHIER